MQYVRNLSDSVSTAWNSINPATLSGAIDVIVVEQEDGTLLCSPFHVRFGKFSLLRPSEKKVEFRVNGAKQDYGMKLGEGGEAFFVFETSDTIPQAMQTSPPMSPASSPPLGPSQSTPTLLPEPDPLSLDSSSKPARRNRSSSRPRRPGPTVIHSTTLPPGDSPFLDPGLLRGRAATAEFGDSAARPYSDNAIRKSSRPGARAGGGGADPSEGSPSMSDRSHSPPAPLSAKAALERAVALSRDLSAANIPTHVTSDGDLMLDMTAFKSNEEDALRAEVFARKLLTDELDGNYDVGSLFGLDEHGNLWIYSSQDAKEAATRRAMAGPPIHSSVPIAVDAASDPGYQSDGSDLTALRPGHEHRRADSDLAGIAARPPAGRTAGDPNRNYAKTLRLTSDQIRALDLRPGENAMSFTVNRATCHAFMYLWRHDTPVVISDIDGTITKSDALGHVLNMIGRDWTHSGIAKLYSDIAANGYNIMYLTSRSVGQADTTRAYLSGIVQDGGFRLPRGPTILSPDRTMAALRREIYLRKPHVFKMATLRDIRSLYPGGANSPFHAGFGNRFTDQISYRTVDVPRTRIFTINSNAEVSLDLLSLNRLKLSYVNINEVVDHYFPPVSTLVKGACEDYTDFKYWRDTLLDVDQFSASESEAGADDADEDDEDDEIGDTHEVEPEEEEDEEGDGDEEDEEDEDGEYEEEDAEGSAYADDEDEEEEVVLDQGTDEVMGDSYFPQRAVEAENGADDEGTGYLQEEEQAEEALPRENGRGDGTEPTPAAERAASPSPPRPISSSRLPATQVVEDIGAEAMTGLENLSLERRRIDRAPEGE